MTPKNWILKAALLVTLWVPSVFALDDLGKRVDLFKIDTIEIRGLKKVEKEAILERILSKPMLLLLLLRIFN